MRPLSRRRFLGVAASAAIVGAPRGGALEKVLAIRSDHSPFFSHPAALERTLPTIARA